MPDGSRVWRQALTPSPSPNPNPNPNPSPSPHPNPNPNQVANTAKRAIIIVGCAIAFGESMADPNP